MQTGNDLCIRHSHLNWDAGAGGRTVLQTGRRSPPTGALQAAVRSDESSGQCDQHTAALVGGSQPTTVTVGASGRQWATPPTRRKYTGDHGTEKVHRRSSPFNGGLASRISDAQNSQNSQNSHGSPTLPHHYPLWGVDLDTMGGPSAGQHQGCAQPKIPNLGDPGSAIPVWCPPWLQPCDE